ncbi:dioxygenase [Arthrobacter sp. MYb229]|uniref:dioxygenase family protein n=1 Tax=Micrococcaceae TaxID=1268 RepID=UPI000CFCE33A|nr:MULTISPECIES: class III extradiol ring-cleavage dioxygenase [unclassified Arthrobacter]PRA04652.1 dioxygenase [Arthrobacter sp. MYb229]PRB51435.1 dioxygenase [Arthrobacter sp. MYb216]
MTQPAELPPVLFLSHGAPPLADDARWTSELADWSGAIDKPKDILMISAHWENAPVTLSATQQKNELVYDFWGFPQKYYDVRYDVPMAPELAAEVERLTATHGHHVERDETRGLDHGAYVPLKEMFPDADVPVVQMSMPTLDPAGLFELGKSLAPLRERGTLIVGSGFTTHNLRWFNPAAGADSAPPAASSEFDHWAEEAMARGDVDSILDFMHKAPAAREAHPRSEHWAPLYVSLGAAYASGGIDAKTAIEGFWYGLSKRSWTLT